MISQSKTEIKNIPCNYHSAFNQLLEKIKAGEKILKLSGLEGLSKFYVITALPKAIDRSVLYLAPSRESGDVELEALLHRLEEYTFVGVK